MIPFFIWIRRGVTTLAAPGLLAASLVIMFSKSGWQYEWNWALSNATTSTLILGPVIAGLVAFDRSRRIEPTLALLCCTTSRRGTISLGCAAWVVYVVVWAITCGTAVAISYRNGAAGPADMWLVLLPPVTMVAAVAFGMAWGSRFTSVIAPLFAALAVYVLQFLTVVLGLPPVFAAGGASGTLVGVETIPEWAMWGITCSSLVALACLMLHHPRSVARTRTLQVGLGLTLCALIASLALGSARSTGDTFQAVDQQPICLRGTVVVCGPEDARPILTMAKADLERTMRELAPAQIEFTREYAWDVGGGPMNLKDGVGLLSVNPESIRSGHLDPYDVAGALSMPRLCAEYFADDAPQGLLANQELVHSWVMRSLSNPPPKPDPKVAATYDALRSCPKARRQ